MSSLRLALKQSLAETGHLGVHQKDKDRRKREKRDKQRKGEVRKPGQNGRSNGGDWEGSGRGVSQVDISKRVVLPSDIAFATNSGNNNRSSASSAASSSGTESDNDTSSSVGRNHHSPQNDSASSAHSDHDTDSMGEDSECSSSEAELEMDGVFDSEVSDEEGKDTRSRGRPRHGRESSKSGSTKTKARDRHGSNADLVGGQTGSKRKIKNRGSNGSKKAGRGSSSKVQTVPPPSVVLIEWMRSMPTGRQRRKINAGLRVKVRFVTKSKKKQDKKCAKWYGGVVTAVASGGKRIRIKYDDGTWEDADFPDKDIVVDCEGNGRHRGQADSFQPSSIEGNSIQPTDGKSSGDSDGVEGDVEDSCDGEMRAMGKSNALSPNTNGVRKREGHVSSERAEESQRKSHCPNVDETLSMEPLEPPSDFLRVSSPHGANSRESPASVTVSNGSAQGLMSGMSTPTSSFDSGSNVSSCQKVSPSSPSQKILVTVSGEVAESAEISPKSLVNSNLIVDRELKKERGKGDARSTSEELKSRLKNGEISTKFDRGSGCVPNGLKSHEKEKKRRGQDSVGNKKPFHTVLASSVVSDGNDARARNGNKLLVPKLDEVGISTVGSVEGNSCRDRSNAKDECLASESKKRSFALVSDPETEFPPRKVGAIGAASASASADDKERIASGKAVAASKVGTTKSASTSAQDDGVSSFARAPDRNNSAEEPKLSPKVGDMRPKVNAKPVSIYMSSKTKGPDTVGKSDSNVRSSPVPSSLAGVAPLKPYKGKKRSREGRERCNSPTPRRTEFGKGSQDGAIDSKSAFAKDGVSSSESRGEGRSNGGSSSEANKSDRSGAEDHESRDRTFGRLSPVPSASVEPVQSSAPSVASVDSSNESCTSSRASNPLHSRSGRVGGKKKSKLRKHDCESVDHPHKHKRKKERHERKPFQPLPSTDEAEDEENETADEDEDAEEEEDKWVQCDRCEKWRRLPDFVNIAGLPERWYCELNHYDPSRNSCEDPEQTQQQLAKEKKARKRSRKMATKPSADASSGGAVNKRGSTGSEASRGTMLDSAEESEGDPVKPARAKVGLTRPETNSDLQELSATPNVAAAVVDQDSSSVGDVESLGDREQSGARPGDGVSQSTPNLDEDGLDAAEEDLSTLHGSRSRSHSRGRNRQRPTKDIDGEKEKRGLKGGKNDAKESESVQWVQCEKCEKWRRLPPNMSPKDLPETWYCSLNTWDVSTASCEAEEDEADRNVRDYTIMSGGVRISSSSSNSSKLSYRNLIFGSGRKHHRPVSERTRAAESLFPSPQTEQSIDAGVPPTVMYAGSSAFVYKGFNGHRASVSHEDSVSFLDLMSNSTLWEELYRGAVAIQALSRASVTDIGRTDDAGEAMKNQVCFALGTKPLSANEVLSEVQRRTVQSQSSEEVPASCTLESTVCVLDDLVREGVVERIHDEGGVTRYKTGNPLSENSPVASSGTDDLETSRSRCMKISKPWKKARTGVETS